MATVSLPSLFPPFLTTALLLLGGGQAAYLKGLENRYPGTFQEDRPISEVQYHEPFNSYQLKEDMAEYQLFEKHNYKSQDKLASTDTAKVKSLLSEVEEFAAVGSEICADEYNFLETVIDCCQVKKLLPKASSGVFSFKVSGGPSDLYSSERTAFTLSGRCDMDTDGGGWMVIQRRVPFGMVNFTRNWNNYENGFGDLNGEFWLGLRNIHCLTTREEVELRIDMVGKHTNAKFWWTYPTFKVAGAEDKYRLTIGGGEGSYGLDALGRHDEMQFSTYDHDNDESNHNCAYNTQGGMWFKSCYFCTPNGPHNPLRERKAYIVWATSGGWLELSSVEMKIRAKTCHE